MKELDISNIRIRNPILEDKPPEKTKICQVVQLKEEQEEIPNINFNIQHLEQEEKPEQEKICYTVVQLEQPKKDCNCHEKTPAIIDNPELEKDKQCCNPCYNIIDYSDLPKRDFLTKENRLSEFKSESDQQKVKDNLGLTQDFTNVYNTINNVQEEIDNFDPLDYNDIISAMDWDGN